MSSHDLWFTGFVLVGTAIGYGLGRWSATSACGQRVAGRVASLRGIVSRSAELSEDGRIDGAWVDNQLRKITSREGMW